MAGFAFGGLPLAELEARILPKQEVKVCASRRRVAAGFRLALDAYRDTVRNTMRNPSSMAVDGARILGQASRQIVANSSKAVLAYWGLDQVKPDTNIQSVPSVEFQMDENLKCGIAALLGCTACSGGVLPSPDECPVDDRAVDIVYRAGRLGSQPPSLEAPSE